MLIIRPTPPWCDTYNVLLTLMAFWWFCRLCSTMKTLCDSDGCQCDNVVGKISCICKYPRQSLEISRDGINQLSLITSSVFVKDCDVLYIKRKSFEDLKNLLRINIINVKNISLEENSFSWNDSAVYETYLNNGIEINIENCTVELPNYAFRGRIDSMLFTNVRFENIKSYAFSSLAGTKSIVFKNCDFINMENQAFKKFTLDRLVMVGGHVNAALPSRTMTDIAIKTEFLLDGVVFSRIRSSAFRIHGPHSFHIQNCYVDHLEGEAFVARTRGAVFIDDNIFNSIEEGAFAGISVEKHVFDVSGHQEFIFENNTIIQVERAALLFNIGSFRPKLDWIYFDSSCECETINHWRSDVVIYTHNYPIEKTRPNILLDEIMSCKIDAHQYMRLKDYSKGYCEEQAHTALLVVCLSLMVVLIVVLFLLLYAYWFRERRSRWINVPQSSPLHEPVGDFQQRSPCYEEPSTSRQHVMVVPERKTYKETELQVIVECTEPLNEYTSRIATEKIRYEPVEYRSRRHAGYRRNLLTSDL